MKTEEDEAFDELARKQGNWGGGYQAKRQMAADKLQEPVMAREALKLALDALENHCGNYKLDDAGCDRHDKAIAAIKAALAQPADNPYGYDWSMLEAAQESLREHMARIKELEAQLAQPAQEPSNGMPTSKAERQLRRMLCFQRHSHKAYMDDGEASFCGDEFHRSIDYMRESPDAIENAWHQAGLKRLKAKPPLPVQRPWVGLTDDEIKGCVEATIKITDLILLDAVIIDVERLLREKNI